VHSSTPPRSGGRHLGRRNEDEAVRTPTAPHIKRLSPHCFVQISWNVASLKQMRPPPPRKAATALGAGGEFLARKPARPRIAGEQRREAEQQKNRADELDRKHPGDLLASVETLLGCCFGLISPIVCGLFLGRGGSPESAPGGTLSRTSLWIIRRIAESPFRFK
jgi:hypothetical protein